MADASTTKSAIEKPKVAMDTTSDGGKGVVMGNKISTRSTRKKKIFFDTPKKFIDHVNSRTSSKKFEAGCFELYKKFYLESHSFDTYLRREKHHFEIKKDENKKDETKKNNGKKDDNGKKEDMILLEKYPPLYDATRVTIPDTEFYYHASYVPGFNRSKEYVIAQAPHDEASQKDFFKMLVHIKAEVVIIADPAEKLLQYLKPDNSTKASAESSEFISWKMSVGGKNDVKMIRLSKWDKTPPKESDFEFVTMHENIRKNIGWNVKTPIVVVCEHGVEKSSIFTVFDIEACRLKEKGKCRLNDTIKMVRGHRYQSIDTYESYDFVSCCVVQLCRKKAAKK